MADQGQDVDAFLSTLTTDRGTALEFAQRRLKRHPEQKELLKELAVTMGVDVEASGGIFKKLFE